MYPGLVKQKGIIHVETIVLAVAPFEGIVDIRETIHARVQTLQHLPVGEGVPTVPGAKSISPDAGGYLRAFVIFQRHGRY